jgi:hypothetical protein
MGFEEIRGVPMADREVFRKNLEAIRHLEPGLVEWLLNTRDVQNIQKTENLYVIRGDGTRHSYYGAEPSLAAEKTIIKSMDLSTGSLTILIGMGLGYTARAILDEMEEGHKLMVLEPNAHILNLALGVFDFSADLTSGSLILSPPEKERIRDVLLSIIGGGTIYGDVHIIPDPRSVALFPRYAEWLPRIQLAFHHATDMVAGASVASKEMNSNELENLLQVALATGLSRIKEAYGRRPVLIVGAGPSLSRSLEWIARLNGKMVLMAFAASWRLLLAHGIKPHVLLSSDKNVASVQMLKHTKHAQDIPLIFSSRAHPQFVRQYAGPRIAVPEPETLGGWLFGQSSEKVSLPASISVGNFALEVVKFLESDPVVLTGMDLAVGEYSHARGHPERRKISDHSSYFTVPGVRGTVVRSPKHLCTIREALELQIRSMEKPVINATAEGARIEGTREVPLQEVSQNLPAMKPPRGLPRERSLLITKPEIRALRSALETFLEEAEEGLINCQKGLDLSKKAVLDRDPKTGGGQAALVGEVNLCTSEVEKMIRKHPFLESFIGEIRYRAKIENARISRVQDKEMKLQMELEKNRTALESVKKDLREVIAIVGGQVARMKDLEQHLFKPKRAGGDLESLPYARFLFDSGFNPEAEEATTGILAKKKDAPETILLMANIRVKQGRYDDARALVENALAIHGKLSEGEELLGVIEREMEQLIRSRQEAAESRDSISLDLVSQEITHGRSADLG